MRSRTVWSPPSWRVVQTWASPQVRRMLPAGSAFARCSRMRSWPSAAGMAHSRRSAPTAGRSWCASPSSRWRPGPACGPYRRCLCPGRPRPAAAVRGGASGDGWGAGGSRSRRCGPALAHLAGAGPIIAGGPRAGGAADGTPDRDRAGDRQNPVTSRTCIPPSPRGDGPAGPAGGDRRALAGITHRRRAGACAPRRRRFCAAGRPSAPRTISYSTRSPLRRPPRPLVDTRTLTVPSSGAMKP